MPIYIKDFYSLKVSKRKIILVDKENQLLILEHIVIYIYQPLIFSPMDEIIYPILLNIRGKLLLLLSNISL